MKKIILLLCIGVFFQTNVLADQLPKTGQYSQTTAVYVEGTGQTLEEAKKDAFRLAIQEVVGVLSISEQAVDGDKLIKDRINEYSAGYIDDFEVVDTHQDSSDRIVVAMNVRVASSKIALRMLAKGDKTTKIQGQLLQEKLQSQLDLRNSGDALLSTVLDSYPRNAFILNQGKTEVKISANRRSSINIPIEITLSKFWIDGLSEALTVVSATNNNCSSLLSPVSVNKNYPGTAMIARAFCGNANLADMQILSPTRGSWFSGVSVYKFHDLETLSMINTHLRPNKKSGLLAIKVDFMDEDNTFISKCTQLPIENILMFNEPLYDAGNYNLNRQYLRPKLNGLITIRSEITVAISNPDIVANLTKVRLTVQDSCN